MRHPYQHIAVREARSPGQRDILLAASGSLLFSVDFVSGKTIDQWPKEISKIDREDSNSSAEIITASVDERAKKRRKITAPPLTEGLKPAIAHLVVSEEGGHAVISTGDDKSVHVLSVSANGQLEHLNQRRMLKRPCAIALTTDDKYILVGDKFGDVYALPLCAAVHERGFSFTTGAEPQLPKILPTPFKPSATNLTVHTGRNLKSLESQKRQSAISPQKKGKETMDFQHELLLGHVSMLTDIAAVALPGPVSKSKREYILTADRDEHIRVSRGQPQAHIVETYCFGHTQFVNKLSFARPDILVSGGGDEDLFVWEWAESRVLTKLSVVGAFVEHVDAPEVQAAVAQNIAISGLWAKADQSKQDLLTIWCVCEAIAYVCEFKVNLAMSPPEISSRVLPVIANVLDLVILNKPESEHVQGQPEFMVSVDVVHKPNSKAFREDSASDYRLLYSTGDPMYSEDDRGAIIASERSQTLIDLFYDTEKLRKRGNEDDGHEL